MAYNIFISYSSKNLHIVEWATSILAKPGFTEVFAAEYSVIPSQVLNEQIKAATRRCDLFLLLYSHDADASKYVQQEIGFAVSANKTVMPVVMEDNLPVPGFISELKYLPAHQDWEGSFQWLAQFVHARPPDRGIKRSWVPFWQCSSAVCGFSVGVTTDDPGELTITGIAAIVARGTRGQEKARGNVR